MPHTSRNEDVYAVENEGAYDDIIDDVEKKCAFLNFVTCDHRYVYLGTSALVLVACGLLTTDPSQMSFLSTTSGLELAIAVCMFAWLALSAVALVVKLIHWNSYDTTFFKKQAVVRTSRIASYLVWFLVLLVVFDRVVLWLCAKWMVATSASSNPSDFLSSAMYMVNASLSMYRQGILTTLGLAVFGTAIAFVLAVLMVFLRIQEPGRSDNDFIKFIKHVGSGFASGYSYIVRGTPMMVQGLIIYSFGFSFVRGFGFSISEVTGIWTYFRAGLVIISLNSTAYIMEALRGGIEAVDPGQAEAARSLGLTQWQAMMKVVFPQGIRNAIPALSNEVVINIKDSSVLSVVGVFDLMFATTTVAGIYYRQMEVYVVAALIYLALTFMATRVLTWISHKLDVEAPGPITNS